MIPIRGEIFIATEPIDLRQSFDRLTAIVREQFAADPRGDAMFVFHNRRRTHIKILTHDGSGYWIAYKRLHRGAFRIPLPVPPSADRVKIDRRELALMLEGIDTTKLREARRTLQTPR